MNTFRLFILLTTLMVYSIGLTQTIVQNGDFENDFSGWTQQGVVNISTSVVQSGGKSFMASDTARARYSYVWQPLSLDYDTHEINFWVYPASDTFYSAFELIREWMPRGSLTFISRVLFRQNDIEFTAVDRKFTFSNILTQNSWNRITITADKTTLVQNLFINGNLVSSLTSSSFPTIEHLLVGDLSIPSMYGTVYFDDISISTSITTDVFEQTPTPSEFTLELNYPNPFNPSTTIAYRTNTSGPVAIRIYNTAGREIKTLINEMQPSGSYSIKWDGRNSEGQKVSSGVYIYRLSVNGRVTARKMLMLK